MFQEFAKHRANDASNDVHRPPLVRPVRPVRPMLFVHPVTLYFLEMVIS